MAPQHWPLMRRCARKGARRPKSWLLPLLLSVLSPLGLLASELGFAADAGLWIELTESPPVSRAQPLGAEAPRCPRRLYLGGRGDSYASGIIRTGSFADWTQPGSVSMEYPSTKNSLVYRAALRASLARCQGRGVYSSQVFAGEVYEYRLGDGRLELLVQGGASLTVRHLGFYARQPVFRVAERL